MRAWYLKAADHLCCQSSKARYQAEPADWGVHHMDNQPVQVVPGLFIGSFMAERNKAALQAAGITHILQAAEGLEPSYPQDFIYMHVAVQDVPGEDLAAHFLRAFAFISAAMRLPPPAPRAMCPTSSPRAAVPSGDGRSPLLDLAPDTAPASPHTSTLREQEAMAPLSQQHLAGQRGTRGGVLVHCVAGISRSATLVIAWLMYHHSLSYDEAFRRLHAVRPWVMPNPGFRAQLQLFEQQGCDPAAWRAWRHSHPEHPGALVKLQPLGRRLD